MVKKPAGPALRTEPFSERYRSPVASVRLTVERVIFPPTLGSMPAECSVVFVMRS
jgi:hypothetical protein